MPFAWLHLWGKVLINTANNIGGLLRTLHSACSGCNITLGVTLHPSCRKNAISRALYIIIKLSAGLYETMQTVIEGHRCCKKWRKLFIRQYLAHHELDLQNYLTYSWNTTTSWRNHQGALFVHNPGVPLEIQSNLGKPSKFDENPYFDWQRLCSIVRLKIYLIYRKCSISTRWCCGRLSIFASECSPMHWRCPWRFLLEIK